MLNENSKENLMARVFLSLGSNKGDRLANIQQAVSMLGMTEDINIVKTSSFYETEPWGNPELKWFLNATLALDTNLKTLDLLKFCQSIEMKLGRDKIHEKWQDRTIDIDILMYDSMIINESNILNIPHPYMHERAFVLVPMLELKSDLIHPVLNKTMNDLYEELENPEDVFLYGTVLPR